MDKANEERIVGQCEISHPVQATPAVAVVDGGPGQEDPDSMGQLLVQKKNVLFEPGGKGVTETLPSPISSKSSIYRVVLFLTCTHAQGSTTLTPTGMRYTHIPTLIFSQAFPRGKSWCTLVDPCGRGRCQWNNLKALRT